VKRIVITSSVAAIVNNLPAKGSTVTFDETQWGDESVRIVMEQGAKAPEISKYRASKTLAEKGVSSCI
jgi:nucleoside-diphosphate-sugar epimerase